MFDKFRENWRKKKAMKARKKTAFAAVTSGNLQTLKTALEAVQGDGLNDDDRSRFLKAAIDRQDVNIFRELLLFIDDPNATISFVVGSGRYSSTRTYSPLSYALNGACTHDITLLLASNPRTNINDQFHIDALKNGMQDVAAVLAGRLADLRRQEAAQLDAQAMRSPEATPQPEQPSLAPGESWALMAKASVAHVTTSEAIGRKLTEIFNFENRERVIITENLKTGAESVGQAESFATVNAAAVTRAEDMLKTLTAEAERKKSLNL
jgi:hypothetical protein